MSMPYGTYTARTGQEFYDLVNKILVHRAEQEKLPKLDDYLGSLWHLASEYKDGPAPQFTYSLLAEWFDRAFDYTPMPYDWKTVLKRPYVWGTDTMAEANTDAYRQEIQTYAYFERVIKRQIEEMKRGYANQPWDQVQTGSVRWENGNVDAFLERVVANHDADDEEEDMSDFYGWYDLVGYLQAGQWTE